jgi:hypothetical protein
MDSLINLAGLTEPAKILIEKISEAIGGIARPYQTVRMARAGAAASIIKAKSDIEVSDIQLRATNRLLLEETRNQNNIESIAAAALPLLATSALPADIDTDWIAKFFDECRIISNSEAQYMWSKVLAGEANKPGSFSKRTLSVLSSLEKQDAIDFNNLCRFAWDLDPMTPIIFDTSHNIYRENGVNYNSIINLVSLGLASMEPSGLSAPITALDHNIYYFGESYCVSFEPSNDDLLGNHESFKIGGCLLSKIGLELYNMCEIDPVDGFVDYVVEQWSRKGNSVKRC